MSEAIIPTLAPGTRVKDRWTIIQKLGAGAFATVYRCQDDNGTTRAMKIVPSGNIELPPPRLHIEAGLLREIEQLADGHNDHHLCRLWDLGIDAEHRFHFIVVTLVGPSLDELMRKSAGGRFSPGTTIGASLQILRALKTIHSIGYLHNNIRPSVAAIGLAEANEQRLVRLIGLGRVRHHPARREERIRGVRFVGQYEMLFDSISAHINRERSRRDELESWLYSMIWLYTGGRLPWSDEQNRSAIGLIKCRRRNTEPADRNAATNALLSGCPEEFGQILAHLDNELKYADQPDYGKIEGLLRACMDRNEFVEHPYDWEV